MNIYDAMMKAADHIERNPRLFNFDMCSIPGDCGTPGCALGWIGYFAGIKNDDEKEIGAVAGHVSGGCRIEESLLRISQRQFYERMDEFNSWWNMSARKCAHAMRLYAAKYHVPKPVVVPDWNAMAEKQTVSTEARSQELVS